MTAYATAEQLYSQPGVTVPDETGTVDLMLSAASIAIDGLCKRKDGFQATVLASERMYDGNGKYFLLIDEFVEVTAVDWKLSATGDWVSVSLLDIASFSGAEDMFNYNRFPYNGIMLVNNRTDQAFPTVATGLTGWNSEGNITERYRKFPNIRVTARWGYSDTVPDVIVQATITQAARWLKRGQSFWADSASTGDFGQLSYRKSLDPDIEMMLVLAGYALPLYGR